MALNCIACLTMVPVNSLEPLKTFEKFDITFNHLTAFQTRKQVIAEKVYCQQLSEQTRFPQFNI